MKMYVWTDRFSFLAVAQAESVAKAREAMLIEMGESAGDGSCPERDKARTRILTENPSIWQGTNAEFVLSDSAEVRETAALNEKLLAGYCELKSQITAKDAEIARLKTSLSVSESIADTLGHPMKSPFCEHSSAYSYTEDGGKTIRCLLCSEAALRIRAEQAEKQIAGLKARLEVSERIIEKAEARLAEAERDKERLDWLEANADCLDRFGHSSDDRWWNLIYNDGNQAEGSTPRAAIDAVRKEAQ